MMQSTEQDFKQVLKNLFELWARIKHPKSKAEFVGYDPDHIGDRQHPWVKCKIGGTDASYSAEHLIQEIWEQVNHEKSLKGESVTTKL